MEGIDRTLPQEVAETGAESRLLACGRHSHISPIALVTKNPAEIKIRSDQLTYRIVLGLLNGTYYSQHPTALLAEYRQALPKGRGNVSLAIAPRDQESWQQVLDSLDLLGDELVDTFLVLLAVTLDIHGTKRITHPFAITLDDILALCQKKKSKGSYLARQRETILAQIHTLARVSVRANLVLRDGKQWQVESPLLEVLPDRQREENRACLGHEALSTCHLKIGDWAGMIPELQSQIALMARQLLHRDGVIGPFAPLVEHSTRSQEMQKRIEQHAYHWWDDYRRQLWLFDPPKQFKALYQRIPEEAGWSD
jgi:hypothetical protein